MNELIERISDSYGIEGLSIHSKDNLGILSENHVLISNDGTKYFLKKYRFENVKKVELIHQVKQFFYSKGIPVILPIKTKVGSTFYTFEGGTYALFPFVEGVVIGKGELKTPNSKSMGGILAKVHLAGKGHSIPGVEVENIGRDKNEFLVKVENILDIISDKTCKDSYDEQAEYILNKRIDTVSRLSGSEYTAQLVNDHLLHGDYHNYNVFFDKEGEVTEVFDWEKSKIGPRGWELARSIDLCCFDTGYETQHFDVAKAFLKAYALIYPISKDEFATGFGYYNYTQIFSNWIESEHYLNNNHKPDAFMERNIKRFDYFSDCLDEVISELSSVLT